MNFSERHQLTMEAEKYCEDNGMKPTPHNIVSALDILGYINTDVRKMYKNPVRIPKPRRTNYTGGDNS